MKFDDWFWELEGYHIRAERFWDDFENSRRQEMYEWLKTAYEIGYEDGKDLYGGTE
jgi:hypothetical protein